MEFHARKYPGRAFDIAPRQVVLVVGHAIEVGHEAAVRHQPRLGGFDDAAVSHRFEEHAHAARPKQAPDLAEAVVNSDVMQNPEAMDSIEGRGGEGGGVGGHLESSDAELFIAAPTPEPRATGSRVIVGLL